MDGSSMAFRYIAMNIEFLSQLIVMFIEVSVHFKFELTVMMMMRVTASGVYRRCESSRCQ